MISEHPISTGFRRLTGYQRDPQDRGFTADVRTLSGVDEESDLYIFAT